MAFDLLKTIDARINHNMRSNYAELTNPLKVASVMDSMGTIPATEQTTIEKSGNKSLFIWGPSRWGGYKVVGR